MSDEMILQQIRAYMEAHTEEMVKDVMDLCRIDSVKGPEEPGMPYGKGPHEALMAARALCEKHGFTTKEYSDRVIAADMNDGPSCLDILAHMDVVAPGDGWTRTKPFEPVVLPLDPAAETAEPAIFGRGSSDDKGPAVAALYAMRAVKELGIQVKGNCRLILGSDEECGSSDIPYYYAVEEEAPMTFSPDAEFPLINIEKGQFRGEVRGSFHTAGNADAADHAASGRRLISLESGETINIVPGKGTLKVAGFKEEEIRAAVNALFNEISADYDLQMEYDEETGETVIFAAGKPAHASTPVNGVNAGVILLQLAAKLPFDNADTADKLQAAARLFPYGDHHGAGVGVELKDEISGYTSLSPDIFRIDEKGLYIKFDSRTCVAANEENTLKAAGQTVEAAGLSFEYQFNPAHAVPAESRFVQELLKAYALVTGKEGRAVAIGGGTYVHGLKNGVAFGAVGETTDTRMHGADEFMLISELKEAAVIYALSIARLCA